MASKRSGKEVASSSGGPPLNKKSQAKYHGITFRDNKQRDRFYPPHCSLKSVAYLRQMKKMEEVEYLRAKEDLDIIASNSTLHVAFLQALLQILPSTLQSQECCLFKANEENGREDDVATCDVTDDIEVSFQMLSHKVRRTKIKKIKFVEGSNPKIHRKRHILPCFPHFRDLWDVIIILINSPHLVPIKRIEDDIKRIEDSFGENQRQLRLMQGLKDNAANLHGSSIIGGAPRLQLRLSSVAPPPLCKNVMPNGPNLSTLDSDNSPKSTVNSTIQAPRRKFVGEGKLRKVGSNILPLFALTK
ncbi:hypothetical protein MTR_6g033355 [Medicago truncatula]|uniref:Uncharacterized protein n=2 Tax=Medicago truncatula TaxID=3880 RepID=A0A072UIL8_MEDTR|nr:hypothetical protein MTR_6g033355 [Medicago truncatula]